MNPYAAPGIIHDYVAISICDYFKIKDLRAKSKSKAHVNARNFYCFLKKNQGYKLKELSAPTGLSVSTISENQKKFEFEISTYKNKAQLANAMLKKFDIKKAP